MTSHLDDFTEHGLCADAEESEDDKLKQSFDALRPNVARYGLPRQELDGRRKPIPLGKYEFDAYNPGQSRWFRTPNDSVQVQTQKASSMLRTMGDSKSGAFHPNGAGYARMADAAIPHLKESLNGIASAQETRKAPEEVLQSALEQCGANNLE